MLYRFLVKDWKQSKIPSLALAFLIMMASCLLISASQISTYLYQSIQDFTEISQTPDLLFMHSGQINRQAIEDFANNNPNISKHQVIDFLNIDSQSILINGQAFKQTGQDNGLVTQAEHFDYLLDLNNQIIQVKDQDIYIPNHYYDPQLKVGDPIQIYNHHFIFQGYLRDSQMNSPLASSKRWLISQTAYNQIKDQGQVEYLIEFQIPDANLITKVEGDYLEKKLPVNGPTITAPLFRLINALSDGLIIFIMVLIAFLIIAIAYLALHITIKQNLQADLESIAVMKAIGLRNKDLIRLYIPKYLWISLSSSILGILIAKLVSRPVIQNIQRNMGGSQTSLSSLGLYAFVLLLVNGLILFYVYRQLSKFKKINPIDGLRGLNPFASQKVVRPVSKGLLKGHPNLQLVWQEIRQNKKHYSLMIMMMVLAIFIMTFPILLYTSLNHPKFHTQVGVGDYDILIDIQQGKESPENIAKAGDQLTKLSGLSFFEAIPYKKVPLAGDLDGYLLCQIKDQAQADSYWKGQAPSKAGEIALSYLASQDLDRQIGDLVQLTYQGQVHDFKVTGIYSDITNGGKSARILEDPLDIPLMKQAYGLQVKEEETIPALVQRLEQAIPFADVTPTQGLAQFMFAPIKSSLSFVMVGGIVVAIGLIGLILYLFLHLNFVEQTYQTAVLTCLGFSKKDIQHQYYTKVAFILILSLFIGYGLVSSLGQVITQAFLQSMGGAGFTFMSPFWLQYLLLPLALLAFTALITTHILTSQTPIAVSQVIKEA